MDVHWAGSPHHAFAGLQLLPLLLGLFCIIMTIDFGEPGYKCKILRQINASAALSGADLDCRWHTLGCGRGADRVTTEVGLPVQMTPLPPEAAAHGLTVHLEVQDQ